MPFFAERDSYMPGAQFRLAGLIVVLVSALSAPAAARPVTDRIIVRGATNVTIRVLSARMHLYPGDPVDFAVLNAAELRLVESDLFSKVRVFIELPASEAVRRMYLDDTNYPVDVVVEAVGKQPWFIFPTASIGSSDWSGGAVYANQNLLGRDVQLKLMIRPYSCDYDFLGHKCTSTSPPRSSSMPQPCLIVIPAGPRCHNLTCNYLRYIPSSMTSTRALAPA